MRKLLLITALAMALLPAAARADGFGILGGAASLDDPPYRYVAISPQTQPRLTVLERLDHRDATIDRWWYLHGNWYVPAVAYDGSAGGLSADGGSMVLTRSARAYPPKVTKLAVLDTRLFLRHPHRKADSPRHAITYLKLHGAFSFDAISPDGSRIYLIQNFYKGPRLTHYDVRALDATTGRLLPGRIVDPEEPEERMEGSPLTRLQSPDGRWAYTLYGAKTPFLHALDTVGGRAVCLDLPQLARDHRPVQLRMKLAAGGRRIVVSGTWARRGVSRTEPLLEVDTKTFEVSRPGAAPTATASDDGTDAAGVPWLALATAAAAFAVAIAWRRRAAG